MATSAVGRCQPEGRFGPGRGDADGEALRRHRRKTADPLVAHHGKGGDGASVRLDAAGLDVLSEGQVFPQDKAGNCLRLREGEGQRRLCPAGGGLPTGAGVAVGRQGGRMVWGAAVRCEDGSGRPRCRTTGRRGHTR